MNESDEGALQRRKKAKNRGNFFLVDVPTFAKVCELSDPDVAAAYLILAAGTGADNRTSSWSREAINQRTALNWRKADACIAKLEQGGFVRWLKRGARPRLDLLPIETRRPMPKDVAALAERIKIGEQPTTPTRKAAAATGRDLGWLTQDKEGLWSFIPARPMLKAYLPNSLVGDESGKATGESTIIDGIRKSRDPMALQLLVDLYALQDLAEHGGIDRFSYQTRCSRTSVMTTGKFSIWRFDKGQQSVRVYGSVPLAHHSREPTLEEKKAGSNRAKDFFARAAILEDAGALEWVYYLAEDASETAPRIYPVAVERHGKMIWSELESIIGNYAMRAALALASNPVGDQPTSAEEWEAVMPSAFILPAERLAREATLVGVPRLRCRAKTSNAARWRKELLDDADGFVQMFRGIIAEHAPELLAAADKRLADFNAVSTRTSTLVQRDINDPSNHLSTGSVLRTAAENDIYATHDLIEAKAVEEQTYRFVPTWHLNRFAKVDEDLEGNNDLQHAGEGF